MLFQVIKNKAEDVLDWIGSANEDDVVVLVLATLLVFEKLGPDAFAEIVERVGQTVVATLPSSPALLLAQMQKVLAVEHLVELLVFIEQKPVQEDVIVEVQVDEPLEFEMERVHVYGLYRVEVVRVQLGYVLKVLRVTRMVEVVLGKQDRVNECFLQSI